MRVDIIAIKAQCSPELSYCSVNIALTSQQKSLVIVDFEGLRSEFGGLAKLDENENLVNTSDFRAMYAALLGQWFQTEAGLVIPGAGTGLPGSSSFGQVPTLLS